MGFQSSADARIINPADESLILQKARQEQEEKSQTIVFGFKEFCTFLGVSPSFIHRKEKEKLLDPPTMLKRGKKGSVRQYTPYDAVIARNKLDIPKPEFNEKIFVFNNMKGGTGKSLQSFSMTAYCACAGLKVLAIDTCAQGHLSQHLGVIPDREMMNIGHLMSGEVKSYQKCIQKTKYANVDLIPGSASLNHVNEYMFYLYQEWAKDNERNSDHSESPLFFFAKLFQKIKNDYDVVIIDTSPAFDLRTQAVILAAEVLIIPVQLAYEATLGMGDFFDLLNWLKTEYPSKHFRLESENIRILPTFYNNFTMSQFVLGFLTQNYGEHLMTQTIRQAELNKQATAHTTPPFLFDKKSEVATDHIKVARELLNIKPLEGHAWL